MGVRAGVRAVLCLGGGDSGSGFCILARTMLGLYGNIPVAAKAEVMLSTVKLATQAEWNRLQNIRFDRDTMPKLLCIRLLSSFVYAEAKGEKQPTSRGCKRCVECGGIINTKICKRSARSMNFIFTWLECPSTISSLRLPWCRVCLSNTHSSHCNPRLSQVHSLVEAAK